MKTTAKSTAKKTVNVKTAAKKASGFEKGSGCYECGVCGKKTRSTGQGDNENVKLCVACWEKAGDENAVLDGQMTQEAFNERYGVNENFLNDKVTGPVTEVTPDATPEPASETPVAPPAGELAINVHAEAEAIANSPEVAAANAADLSAKAKKEKLTLPKLRRVGDILNALKAGAWIVREDGLYRLSLEDGQKQPVSKRRCIACIDKGVVVPLAAGMSKGFVSAWQLAPVEKTPEAPKAPAKK